MSGGYFDYIQYPLREVANDIENLIENNSTKDEWGFSRDFSQKTLTEFKNAMRIVNEAATYIQRIDWLVSGDDSEESFHKRLNKEKPREAKEG